ncbi:MAG: FAD-dependent oxidoreductase, partial [Anaerolineales bacterium]|nr:FAD-dependent oxidoreductase [Anaerolineales bacterium]
MHRRARFIWIPDQKVDEEEVFRVLVRDGPKDRRDGLNRWVFFRREIDLGATPDTATMRITADSRYQLFINGERVGRGPVRSPSYLRRYDTYDIAAKLKPGKNVFAVLVHVYGADTAWYEIGPRYPRSIFGDGGLWIEADIETDGETQSLLSDPQWRCHRSGAWQQDTPTAGWGQGLIEDVDGNRLPDGWTQSGFDDSGWAEAREMVWEGIEYERAMGWGPHEAFPTIAPNDLPHLEEREIYAAKICGQYAVTPDPGKDVGQRLYEETFAPAPAGMVKNAEALLSADGVTMVHTDDRDVSILIDFGPIHTGYPFIEIDAEGGEVIELAASEKVKGDFTDVLVDLPRIERPTHLDCAQIFRYTARPGVQRFEKFDWTGVRYLQLMVRNAPKGLKVRRVGSVLSAYPVGERGKFACSDPFLDQLWQVGRYTAQQCTSDAWCDGPGREKRQWIGDGLVHYLIDAAAFGPGTQTVDRQFLRAGADAQRPDGMIQMFAPGDHHGDGVAIVDFPLHWISACEHYLMHTGDLDFIASIYPAVQKVLQWYEPHLDADGLIVNPPLWRFIEWAALDRAGISAAMNLSRNGYEVTVLESREFVGGRMFSFTDGKTGDVIDNGQHVMIGAYHSFLGVLDELGTAKLLEPQKALQVRFVDKEGQSSIIDTSKLWGDAGLLYGFMRLNSISKSEKFRAVLFFLKLKKGIRGIDNLTVRRLLIDNRQSENIIVRFWEPYVLATMNTRIDSASAKLFVDVLKKALLSGSDNSKMIIHVAGLSELVAPFGDWLADRGEVVKANNRVEGIIIEKGKCIGVA